MGGGGAGVVADDMDMEWATGGRQADGTKLPLEASVSGSGAISDERPKAHSNSRPDSSVPDSWVTWRGHVGLAHAAEP